MLNTVWIESTSSQYLARQKPCDLLVTHDSYTFVGYGIAYSSVLDPHMKKWWIDSSQCKKGFVHKTSIGTLYSFSGVVSVFLAGLFLLLIIFGVQFSRKIQDKESRMHQLTFDDINLDSRLPTPPPELLNEPPPVDAMTHL
ncbi:hypothetical protein CEXT_482152 [Caerostris extrusa]|uniref:Uncharacterized protein n=1 Tax=Caerostris extrusa TaxID=172846 RepID=A0AAV4MEV9_CAEEX|nr:hypothetical protein CEXT_482152 [Caerostris extrusa]